MRIRLLIFSAAAFLSLLHAGYAAAPGPVLPPDIQRITQKAQSGQPLSAADMARLQQFATQLQPQIQKLHPAATRTVTQTNSVPCKVRIGYTFRRTGPKDGSDCGGNQQHWTEVMQASASLTADAKLARFRPDGPQGREIVRLAFTNGTGQGGVLYKGDSHPSDTLTSNWNASEIRGLLELSSSSERGDNFGCEPQLTLQGSSHYAGSVCDKSSSDSAPNCSEGGALISLMLLDWAKEQFYEKARPEALDAAASLARTFGQKLPTTDADKKRIIAGRTQAWQKWQQERFVNFSMSRRALDRDLASGQPFLIIGRSMARQNNSDGSQITGSLTLSVSFGETPLEVVVSPQDYENWLPNGGSDEKTAGNTLDIKAALRSKNNMSPPADLKARKFTFELSEVSTEPGVCLNLPVSGATGDPDLKFESGKNGELSVTDKSAETKDDATEATATISCFDYGAFGSLKVTAELEDGHKIVGYLRGQKGTTLILLPKRDASSKIGSKWKKAGYGTDESDDDKQSGNSHNGDGFSVYEEYRGLITKNGHTRLDPERKELIVENRIGDTASAAFGTFGTSGIKVIELKEGALPSNRVVNINHFTTHGGNDKNQCGVIIKTDAAITAPDCAEAVHISGKEVIAKSPKECDHVGVRPDVAGDGRAAPAIAHELAHACGVKHHGDKAQGILPGTFVQRDPTTHEMSIKITTDDTKIKLYDSDGAEIATRPYTMHGEVGIPHSKSSGDDTCLMFYEEFYQWALHDDGGGSYSYWAMKPHPAGTKFCTSKDGTGINKTGNRPTNYFGDAEMGNCTGQFRVRDW